MAVDPGGAPAARLETLELIDRIGERQRAVDRNTVVVEQHDQLGEPQVARERDGFVADAFHEVAVGCKHEGAVIDDVGTELRREMPLRDRHADRIAEALAEWSRGGLDARRMIVFRVSGRERPKLAKTLDLLDRHRLVAEKVEQRVDQHRAVAGRQHETVTIGPVRIGRIELQEPREQDGGDVGRPHGQARMAAFRLLDRVHGERPNGIRHAFMCGTAHRCRYFGTVLRPRRGDELVP